MTHRDFTFQLHKTLQAAVYILRLAGGNISHIDLLKMLYLADRECFAEEGETITGDSMSALKRGPVLRTVLNLIVQRDSQSLLWNRYIESRWNKTKKHFELSPGKESPGEGDLYRFEKEILEQVFERFKGEDLVAYTHTLPEWKKFEQFINDPDKRNSYQITVDDLIEGIGNPDLHKSVARNAAARKAQAQLFGAPE